MRIFAVFFVALLALTSLCTAGAATPNAGPSPLLRLHRATFDARSQGSVTPSATHDLRDPYAIIQLRGPITLADRAALVNTGVKLLEYLPDYAYVVRGDPAQLAAAERLPQVYARTPFTVADKLAPSLQRALARGDASLGQFQIIGWPDDSGALRRDLRALVKPATPSASAGSAVVQSSTATLLQIAGLPSVRWIEPVSHPRLLNDVARTIMHVDAAAWQSHGLFGTGQIVAVADSGLDTGSMATLSPDFAGRIVATHVLSAGDDLGDNNGHGTHVAGSLAGAGALSGADPAQHQYVGSFAGVAPEASLVILAFYTQPDGSIVGLDPDYYTLFAQSYAGGARLQTNSWGDLTGPSSDPEAAFGGYPYGSQRTDEFLWDHPDMSIFFAAGNSGVDGTPAALGFCTGGNGVIDPDSLLEPGTAKNVVTVGASENLRTTGGVSGLPWLLFSFCYATQPIATDYPSNNINGMAAFSSRGPTDDGRAKPDIVAPGTNIVSARSHYPGAGTLYGVYETNADYVYSAGTSMATPLAAGTGVLVRQWLTQHGFASPSGAAVKATLLNTAADMGLGQYGPGVTQEIPSAQPNSVNGWGRADLGFMNASAPYGLWVDDHTTGITTNQSVNYTDTPTRSLNVQNSSQPLRVMLAWTDPPASLSAAAQLVNDLDLVVTGPDGNHYGNNVPTGDRTNNVEGVIITNPPIGTYTIQVRGHNVPIATQPYALAVGGPLNAAPGTLTLNKTADPSSTIAPSGLITYTLTVGAQNGPISGAVLTDTLPISTTFVAASGSYTPSGSGISWPLGNLTSGQTVTRTLTVQVAPNLPDNTTISNAQYGVTGDSVTALDGVPVNVAVEAPQQQRQWLWLPLLAR